MTTFGRPLALLLLCCLAQACAFPQWFGGGGGSKSERVTFILCSGAPCQARPDATNHYVVSRKGKLKTCYISAKSLPTGSPVLMRLRRNGADISAAALAVQPGQAGAVKVTVPPAPLAELDVLTIDITQIGAGAAGQDITLSCLIE